MTSPYGNVEEYRLLITEDLRAGGSEFGGVVGLVQPFPHEMTPSETLQALYATNPTDPLAYVETDEAAPPIHREG